MDRTKHNVFKQDHRGAGVLQSEHDTFEQAYAAAVAGRNASTSGLLTANIWYVASPLSDGRFHITYAIRD